jgi:hypothetical protein
MKSIRILIFVFAFTAATLAQAPQSTDKTPGQSNPTGEPASNLPQSGVSAPAPKPAPSTPATAATTAPAKTANNGEVDPFLETPPLPDTQVTLIGGTVKSIDRIRNRLTVEPFQAKPIKMFFDERSHIYRDGVETTMMGINKGDRVYVDTQLDRPHVFARNIHVVTAAQAADARGQIISLHGSEMSVQDDLSGQPVNFRIDPQTVVKRQQAAGSQADLAPGSIVAIRFAAGPRHDLAKEIAVLASPGQTFKFYGEITFLDLSRGLMALHNQADDKTYELKFDPAAMPPLQRNSLHVGLLLSIDAAFTGKGYKAEQITLAGADTAK